MIYSSCYLIFFNLFNFCFLKIPPVVCINVTSWETFRSEIWPQRFYTEVKYKYNIHLRFQAFFYSLWATQLLWLSSLRTSLPLFSGLCWQQYSSSVQLKLDLTCILFLYKISLWHLKYLWWSSYDCRTCLVNHIFLYFLLFFCFVRNTILGLQLTSSPPCWMTINYNKRFLISFIVPVIQHGRQGLCHLNLSGMVANQQFPSSTLQLCSVNSQLVSLSPVEILSKFMFDFQSLFVDVQCPQ